MLLIRFSTQPRRRTTEQNDYRYVLTTSFQIIFFSPVQNRHEIPIEQGEDAIAG